MKMPPHSDPIHVGDSDDTSFGDFIEDKALRKMRHPTRIRKLEGFIELPGA